MQHPHPKATLILHSGSPTNPLQLKAMGCAITVHCHVEARIGEALRIAFAGLQADPHPGTAHTRLEYIVRESGRGLELTGDGYAETAHDLGDLVYLLDKQITLALQRARKDLVFIHGAAVTTPDGRVCVLTAASGSGKSTFTWALLHHGFGYLSDELAPIHPDSLGVEAYPHALCLKRRPPQPYEVPAETLTTSRSLHVPVAASGTHGPLAAILFVDHRHPENHTVLTALNSARAALRLYPNTLNPLAHPNDGLDAIAAIARQVPCYEVNTASLATACETLRTQVISA